MTRPKSKLDETYASLLARRVRQGRVRQLTVRKQGSVDFSSNGYLSLSTHPEVKSAYLSRLQQDDGQFSLGSGGSRLLDGNTTAIEQLESHIAAFHGAESGLLFNSGFDANTGLFSCAPQPGDVIVYDELIHASVHDGMRLSRARKQPFAHNCVVAAHSAGSTQLKSLDEVLMNLSSGESGQSVKSGDTNVFIAVESVYSMDGDVSPLQHIVECVERRLPKGNGYIIVDEAHSTGWMGSRGRGLVSQLGLESRVWARVHTFGKAMGCAGAIVLCSPTARSYLINYARSLIYTTAMSYPMLAAIQTTYDYLASGQADPLLINLLSLMQYTHHGLLSLCQKYSPPSHIFHINTSPPASPILPLFSGQAKSLATHCQQKGFTVRPIVYPTVPKGTDRVRLCLHASNTAAEVRGFCAAVEEWLRDRLIEHDSLTRRVLPQQLPLPASVELASKL